MDSILGFLSAPVSKKMGTIRESRLLPRRGNAAPVVTCPDDWGFFVSATVAQFDETHHRPIYFAVSLAASSRPGQGSPTWDACAELVLSTLTVHQVSVSQTVARHPRTSLQPVLEFRYSALCLASIGIHETCISLPDFDDWRVSATARSRAAI
jgi:hypothetical protein